MSTFQLNTRILFVDDEPHALASLVSLFLHEGLEVHTLAHATGIDDMLAEHGPFAVVVSDQRMLDRDGVATLDRVRQYMPDTIRVLLTGHADRTETERAINRAGISRFITKPWDDTLLKRTVHECVQTYNTITEHHHLTAELRSRKAELEELHDGTLVEVAVLLQHLSSCINVHVAQQTDRVRATGCAVLDSLGDMSPEERWDITRALELFNLGISVLPPWVQTAINKEGLWVLGRFPAAHNHHLLAYDLLKDIPCFGRVARIIQLSHKDFDGTGEPVTVPAKGAELPFGSRLLHILVDLDSLSTEHQRAHAMLRTMRLQPGKYDPAIVAVLIDLEGMPHTPCRSMSVRLDALTPGMVLTDDLVTIRGHIMFRAGSEVTTPFLRVLSRSRRHESIEEPVTVRVRVPPDMRGGTS